MKDSLIFLDKKIKALENLVKVQDEFITELKSRRLEYSEIEDFELRVWVAKTDVTDVEDRMWSPEI